MLGSLLFVARCTGGSFESKKVKASVSSGTDSIDDTKIPPTRVLTTRKYLQHDFHPVVNWERHILESPAKNMGILHLQYVNNTSQAE